MNIANTTLNDYCRGFAHAHDPWPALPLPDAVELGWWREQLVGSADGSLRGDALLNSLCQGLPQLLLPQVAGISSSELYKALVLRGEDPDAPELRAAREQMGPQPHWQEPEALTLTIAEHPCGAMPVLHTSNRHDFDQFARALAHRGEPNPIADGVHAKAVSGLIHWGLIKRFGRQSRARLIVLHQAPYGSVGAEHVPGSPSEASWIAASTTLRLEHELTHLATKQVLGEMRINLLDELVADAMGMIAALGFFNAALFGRCLGLTNDDQPIANGRWISYTRELSADQSRQVLEMVMQRARELETYLNGQPDLLGDDQSMQRLQWLCQQQLNAPITPCTLSR